MRALLSLLGRANESKIDRNIIDASEKIYNGSGVCKRPSTEFVEFKLTVGAVELRFSHQISLNTIFIQRHPELHMVAKVTHFCAALCL